MSRHLRALRRTRPHLPVILFAGLAAPFASAGNIEFILTPTTPGPYVPNINVTICVSLLALDPNDAGVDPDPDNPFDQTLLADIVGVQIDRALSTAIFIGNPIVPTSGDCSVGTPLPGGGTYTAGTATVWYNSAVGGHDGPLYSLTPGTPSNIFRIIARSSPQPGESTTVDVIGPCNANIEIGAALLTFDNTAWENCNPAAHGSLVGSPLELITVPDPASLALTLAAALPLCTRRRPRGNPGRRFHRRVR